MNTVQKRRNLLMDCGVFATVNGAKLEPPPRLGNTVFSMMESVTLLFSPE